jgi:two-component system, LytTR family, response regulator
MRVLIVDDEDLARERVRSLLQAERDVEIVAECGNGFEAIRAIEEHDPDLVFLDVQMPQIDGFGVLEAVRHRAHLPAVVFVTAYDTYALKAFEVHAVDYLLKPFDRERFQDAVDRVRRDRAKPEGNRALQAMLDDARKRLKRFVIRSPDRIYFVPIDDVDWIEAAGNYVRLHVGAESHLLRDTMNHLDESLDPERFLRIHRSTIVNVSRIRELQPTFGGDHLVLIHDGSRLQLSRRYHSALERLLGGI